MRANTLGTAYQSSFDVLKKKPRPPKKSSGGRVKTKTASTRGGIGMDRSRTCVGKR